MRLLRYPGSVIRPMGVPTPLLRLGRCGSLVPPALQHISLFGTVFVPPVACMTGVPLLSAALFSSRIGMRAAHMFRHPLGSLPWGRLRISPESMAASLVGAAYKTPFGPLLGPSELVGPIGPLGPLLGPLLIHGLVPCLVLVPLLAAPSSDVFRRHKAPVYSIPLVRGRRVLGGPVTAHGSPPPVCAQCASLASRPPYGREASIRPQAIVGRSCVSGVPTFLPLGITRRLPYRPCLPARYKHSRPLP